MAALIIGPLIIFRSPAPNRCYLEWQHCIDITGLVRGWAFSSPLRSECRRQAEQILGKLSWPAIVFRFYYTNNPRISDGTAFVIEHDSKTRDQFGDLSVSIECKLDLRERKVVSVRKIDRPQIINR